MPLAIGRLLVLHAYGPRVPSAALPSCRVVGVTPHRVATRAPRPAWRTGDTLHRVRSATLRLRRPRDLAVTPAATIGRRCHSGYSVAYCIARFDLKMWRRIWVQPTRSTYIDVYGNYNIMFVGFGYHNATSVNLFKNKIDNYFKRSGYV